MGDRVFFAADDRNAGLEPWAGRTAVLLAQPGRAIQDLIHDVQALGLPFGVSTSLTAKLAAAAEALAGDRTAGARGGLEAFAKGVDSLTPRWVTPAAADDLKEFATDIGRILP